MKKVILLLILVMIPVALAKTAEVELKEGESYSFDGRNITLLELDKTKDKVVVCINNEKKIISDYVYVKGINIDLKWVKEDSAKFEFRYSMCEDCDYGNWDNLDCFNECSLDKDCDDSDEDTIDKCDGKPKKCVYEEIKKEVKEEEKVEEKEEETIGEKVTSDIVKEQPREFKSFTQWLFDIIVGWFR